MIKDTAVSCIIPIYNAEPYLNEFFDSLMNQTFQNFEIICVDDASTDLSMSIISEYQKQRDIVLIENKTRSGAACSRNKGLEAASGDYVIFLDCDDILHPEMLGRMYECCRKNDADIGICYLECFVDNKRIPIAHMEKNRKMIPGYPVIENPARLESIFQIIMHASYDKMVRRKLLLQNDITFQDLPCTNDLFYSCSCVLCSCKIVFIDKVLYFIRYKREGSITTTWFRKKDFICEALDAVFDFALGKGIYKLVQKSFIDKAIKDIYNGLERFSEVYLDETVNKLKTVYLEKWGIMEWYNEGRLSMIQMKIIDNILHSRKMASYCSILLSCSDEKIIKLISDYKNNGIKIVWWGAGKMGSEFLTYFNELGLSIDYVIDSDVSKHGKEIAGYSILGWESVIKENCVIWITDDLWFDDINTATDGFGEIINIFSYLEQRVGE